MSKLRTFALTVLLGLCAFSYANAKSIILTSPEDYQVIEVSPNGKWACGIYVDYSQAEFAFLWNLESGTITMLSSSTESEAYDVSNDGVVAGRFADDSFSKNGITVSMPGYYKDGKWHSVEYPEGKVPGYGVAHGITPDGHYMAGYMEIDGKYTPYIWKDGKIYRRLGDGDAVPYDISPDGQSATGWEYGPVHHNRVSTYWKADGTIVHINDYESMFSAGKRFSQDGKKILFWGGWDDGVSNLSCVYDTETGEITKYPTLVKDAEMDVLDINNNGTFVGYESGKGYINKDGQGYYAYDYLTDLGVDFSDVDILMQDGEATITRAQSISEDEGVIVLIYYDSQYAMRSMVVMPNREPEYLAPVEIKAAQMDGIASARLTWKEPLGAKEIAGYNVYRGETKLNATPVTDLYYYDAAVGYGSYSYSVAAVYDDGTETKADAVSVTLSEKGVSQPQALFTRQKGFNSALVQWETPESNLITKGYTDISTANLQGFGINTTVNFETAIRFAKEEVACYKGCKLTQVSFYPMSEQAGWGINIYTRNDDGSLKLITSQDITQDLTYRAKNTVKLDEPVTLPDGELIVAIEVNTTKVSSSIIGMDYGTADAGNSDLLRQVTEDDFYSLYETSQSQGYPYVCSWMLDAVFAPEGSSEDVDVIDHYEVYADNAKVGDTQDKSYEVSDLADGTHTVGVSAVYANGNVSATTDGSVDIAKRYVAVDNVAVTHDTNTGITATWSAPADNDATEITYSSDVASSKGARAPDGYTLMAGVIYTPSMIKGYDGYQVKSFKFYPHSDALYTFYLIKDEETVCELEVDDYELDQWNTVTLKTPVTIDESATYQLVLDCYDVASGEYGLSIDNSTPLAFYSDLYSITNGSSWSSLTDTGIYGNWMMGMNIAAADGKTLEVDGYDVRIDGVKQNSDMLKTTSFAYDFGTEDATRHSVNVDVYYPAKSESVEGGATYFYIGTAGIGSVDVATLNLRQGDNYLKVEGSDVKGMTLYSVNGMRLSAVSGDTMSLSGIGNGVYVVKVATGNGTVTRKIKVVK